jgi:hypothetical protein
MQPLALIPLMRRILFVLDSSDLDRFVDQNTWKIFITSRLCSLEFAKSQLEIVQKATNQGSQTS